MAILNQTLIYYGVFYTYTEMKHINPSVHGYPMTSLYSYWNTHINDYYFVVNTSSIYDNDENQVYFIGIKFNTCSLDEIKLLNKSIIKTINDASIKYKIPIKTPNVSSIIRFYDDKYEYNIKK